VVPPFADDRPIIIFDGKCVLCSRFAQFILRTDRRRRYRLLAAQSGLGAALYRHFGLDPVDYETNVFLAEGRVWLKAESSIRIFEGLGGPWPLAGLARLLPLAARDGLYDLIARNRLKWFGTRESCFLPSAAEADRFLA
jgi:predicted DCC family thiol-disulfide oxidoreductase YuxK